MGAHQFVTPEYVIRHYAELDRRNFVPTVTKATAGKRNRAAQDATLINVRALKKQVAALEKRVTKLEGRK